jgi:aspartate racemase
MKKIGLVGGISWTSTIDYYKYINEGINEKLGGLNFAEMIIYSLNYYNFQKNGLDNDFDASFKLLFQAAQQLKKSGAQAIVLGANTAHTVAQRLELAIGLPLIHIVDAVAMEINKKGFRKVGLLGTKLTMELPFYKDKLKAENIEVLIPKQKKDRAFIHETLTNELGKGIIKEETKQRYISIINEMINNGAEGIVLGCTEIPLLIDQKDVSVSVFNTTKIHAQAAVDFALDS